MRPRKSSACGFRYWSRSTSDRIAAVSNPGRRHWRWRRSIAACRSLRFAGIQAYHGKAQHIYDPAQRAEVVDKAVSLVRQTVDLLRSHGLECERVSGGGTGTYRIEAASGVYNEVQAGSYIFMDADYQRVQGDGPTFESASSS